MDETSWKIPNLENDKKKRYRREHKNKHTLTDPLKFLSSPEEPDSNSTRGFVEGLEPISELAENTLQKINNLKDAAITTDVSGGSVFNLEMTSLDILGILANKKNFDYADQELIDDISKNRIGFFSSLKVGGCIGGDPQNTINIGDEVNKIKDKGSEKAKQMSQLRDELQDASEQIKDNPFFKFIKENLKYVEYPTIYFRWLEKKVGIKLYEGLAKIQNIKLPDMGQVNAEMRYVNSVFSKLFSLILTFFVTYNWFFLMFYEHSEQRMSGWQITRQYFRDSSPFLNFLLEFILYPLYLLNEFMMSTLPEYMNWAFVSSDLIFLVMFVTIYKIMNSWGYAIVDLFFDSLKILFNPRVKPWDAELQHVYTDPNHPVSPTLRTYWFLHILVFGGQIPSIFPSHFEKYYNSLQNNSRKQKEAQLNQVVENILPTNRDSDINVGKIMENNDNREVRGGTLTDAQRVLEHELNRKITEANAAIATGSLNEDMVATMRGQIDNYEKELAEINNPSRPKTDILPSPIIEKTPAVSAAVGTAAAAAMGPASLASGFLSGAKHITTDLLRFGISHFFITIAAMAIAFYLFFYSFFGILCFSKISLHETMVSIDDYIKDRSTDGYRKRCGIQGCSDTWAEWLYDKLAYAFHATIQMVFKHYFIGGMITVLANAIANTATVLISSKIIELNFKFLFAFIAIFITVVYALKDIFYEAVRGKS